MDQVNDTGRHYLLIGILVAIVAGCGDPAASESEGIPALKDVFSDEFRMGAALNQEQVHNPESEAMELVKRQYNSITPENLLKWQVVHPQPDSFNFVPADKFIEFGAQNGMHAIGHTLVWHRQTPDWVFVDDEGDPLDRNRLLDRMEDHISAVAGKYQGQIDGWDVVNEVFEEDGSLRQSKWYEIIGEDYIKKAFRFAHAADSSARLYYNDFNLWKPEKRNATVNLVQDLQSEEIRIDAVGMQSHLGLENPSTEQIEESILVFSQLGVDVMISEIDINVTRYLVENEITVEDELPDHLQQKLADRYKELFELFDKHSNKISRVTFWGVNDRQSWLNYWEDSERPNYPLLFDRDNQPKPAFYTLIESFNN